MMLVLLRVQVTELSRCMLFDVVLHPLAWHVALRAVDVTVLLEELQQLAVYQRLGFSRPDEIHVVEIG